MLAPLQPSPKLWLWWPCGEKVEFYSRSSWQGSLSPEEEICAGDMSELLKVFPTNCHDFDSAGIKLASVASFSEQPHSCETERKSESFLWELLGGSLGEREDTVVVSSEWHKQALGRQFSV